MLDGVVLEQRLTALEQAVTAVKKQLAIVTSSGNWLEQVIGSIPNLGISLFAW